VDWILRHSENIDVYAVSGPSGGQKLPAPSGKGRPVPLRAYLYAVGLVGLVTVAGQFIHGSLEPTNLTMMYLLAVVIVAVQWGRGPSILAATLAVLAFDFFFVPPRFTMAVADTEYVITFAGLLVVGLVISALAGRVRDQVHAARQREAATAALYALSRDLAAASATEEILASIVRHVGTVFNRRVSIFIASDGRPEVAYQSPEFPLTDNEQAVAAWVMQHGEQAGRGTETLPAAQARYVPLKTAQGVKGVLGVVPAGEEPALTPEQQQLLQAFASQAALALERVQTATASQRRALSRETEKLQGAVLNSISHDLRTPLASVSGALSTLLDGDVQHDELTRRSLLETAKEGADRLTRLVTNLLDMTRVEAGALSLRKEPGDIEDLVGAALAQTGGRGQEREVEFDLPADLPSVPMDFALMTQALSNILDNALKYSPADQPVRIEARTAGGEVHVSVADRGPGIPEADLARIFEKFQRAAHALASGGLGLGLTISRGIIEAHGGRIWAVNRPGGGAVVTFALPYVLGEPGEIRERLDEPAGTAPADR
jgi:two-component system sensor histidine kinase KdpD